MSITSELSVDFLAWAMSLIPEAFMVSLGCGRKWKGEYFQFFVPSALVSSAHSPTSSLNLASETPNPGSTDGLKMRWMEKAGRGPVR